MLKSSCSLPNTAKKADSNDVDEPPLLSVTARGDTYTKSPVSEASGSILRLLDVYCFVRGCARQYLAFSLLSIQARQRKLTMSDFEQIDLDGNAKTLKFYTFKKKLEVVAYAKKAKSINSASKRYNVDRKCVRKWMEQEEQLSKFKLVF
uniref:Brinker DNA-binding domain-containing protein n=1 Tax=Ditylenchus dipsaci TaxID=166011 RepID=A0A915DNI0_9BILA